MIKNFSLLILFLSGIFLTAGDVVIKKWVNENNKLFYLIAWILYLIGVYLMIETFKSRNIAVATALSVIFNVVTLTIFTYFYFKEPLSTGQLVGIILSVSAIICLEMY